MKTMFAAAIAGAALASPPAAAQGTAEVKIDQRIIYGDEACPQSSEDTIVVCSRKPESDRYRIPDNLRDSLQRLGAVGADDLLALEVIWQPEGAGEVLSSEELITAYPDLQHL